MSVFDTSRTAYGASHAVSGFSSFVTRMVATVVAWNDARVTRNALSALSDRELEDIGLIRGDIDSVIDTELRH